MRGVHRLFGHTHPGADRTRRNEDFGDVFSAHDISYLQSLNDLFRFDGLTSSTAMGALQRMGRRILFTKPPGFQEIIPQKWGKHC